MQKTIIISISSDIGTALAKHFLSLGHQLTGTYRKLTAPVAQQEAMGCELLPCDLASPTALANCCQQLQKEWDNLFFCPGTLEPIGSFESIDFEKWEQSFHINFMSQMAILKKLLPYRRTAASMPTVLFFAGGGTNGAPVNFSAYTTSKIATIKMCELLDAEIHDCKFSIIGPGWVDTKIHQETLKAPSQAPEAYKQTLEKYSSDDFTPMENVIRCCDWIINSPKKLVSGRNFSVVHDHWEDPQLNNYLLDKNIYKLRRYGN